MYKKLSSYILDVDIVGIVFITSHRHEKIKKLYVTDSDQAFQPHLSPLRLSHSPHKKKTFSNSNNQINKQETKQKRSVCFTWCVCFFVDN